MSDIAQPNVRQQLQMLKEQTRLTGGLHDAQVLQLKMWPLVVFDEALTSEFTWDPDKKVVKFNVQFPAKLKKKRKLEWWKERVTALNGWVQTLLGDEWCIQVKVDQGAKPTTFNGSRKIADGDAGSKQEVPRDTR